MTLEYYKVEPKKATQPIVCPHNDACRCIDKNCGSCGWHPSVMKSRYQKLFFGKEAKV
jgi:hypothetical protein